MPESSLEGLRGELHCWSGTCAADLAPTPHPVPGCVRFSSLLPPSAHPWEAAGGNQAAALARQARDRHRDTQEVSKAL